MSKATISKKNYYTPDEYLTLEAESTEKHEYFDGVIVSMAGASLNHNQISSNIQGGLFSALANKPCKVFSSDLRVWVETENFYTYPDIVVICGQPELLTGRTDTITNPKIIIEILSKSTATYDKGDKFDFYWSLNAFEEYVLVNQYKIWVKYLRKKDDKVWELRVFTRLDDVLDLKAIGVKIFLCDIYRNIKL